jgi:hypothetical protein
MIVIVAIGCGFYFAREPWRIYREQRAKANSAIAEAQANDRLHVSLVKNEAELRNPIGREKTAREHGYVKQGEVQINSDLP